MRTLTPDEVRGWPWGLTPEPCREYAEVPAACDGCEAAGHVLEGHFACEVVPVPEGWRDEAKVLTQSGWRRLISRRLDAKKLVPEIIQRLRKQRGRWADEAADQVFYELLDFVRSLGQDELAEVAEDVWTSLRWPC